MLLYAWWLVALLLCIYNMELVAAIGLGCLMAALFLHKEKDCEDDVVPISAMPNMKILHDAMLAAITKAAIMHGVGRKKEE